MNECIVKIENLSHRYSSSWAIKDISFEIRQTGILGLLGSNGAGKSTTMNILCGVLNQTSGKVYIDGIDLAQHPESAKKQIGFLPQEPPLYRDLTVDEYLIHCAHLRFVEKDAIKPALEATKELCGITHFSKRLIGNLSGGYRQRVGIAQAIIHRPKLVVLDEPTNGLDPNQIVEVRSLIKDIARDRAVIFSTHILSEVQLLCNEIRMIEGGKMVFADTMDAFNNYVIPHSVFVQMNNPPPLETFLTLRGVNKVDFLSETRIRLYFDNNEDIVEKVVSESVKNDWQLREISMDRTSIDEIFAQLSNKTAK